ncbi:MAG: DUF1598 domain-containing protein, partial [Planctomycetia bacterium]|nr:DUF1598 domain-containing protein [Planctomycetia bacterium]
NSSGSTGGSGIMIQADGVLKRIMQDDGSLDRARQQAIFQSVPGEMQSPSLCRKVSLTRLEKLIAENQGRTTAEMQNLAGLIRIENVFIYPETGDIVIAGPAEGWTLGRDNAIVGMRSQRPTLQLDDLVAALRAFPPNGKATQVIGCSIDPTDEGLRNMQTYLHKARKPNLLDQRQLAFYADGIRNSLGLQNVQIWGVSPKTHFAGTMVAADYRMKLIGIGLEKTPVRMITYIDKSNPLSVSSNALVRWFFQPDYQCVVLTEDHLGMKIVGESVQLVGENEVVTSEGKRIANASHGNRATKMYARSFTDKYPQIAKKVPVYASLRNLIDMSVVAAYLQKEKVYDKVHWTMDFFGSEEKFPIELGNEIRQADTAVQILHHKQGQLVSFPTGGGVMINPQTALEKENIQYEKKEEISSLRSGAMKNIPADRWWWD